MMGPGHDRLWGWDTTPGIVSVHATIDGHATVWRRLGVTDKLVCEQERFRPWLILAHFEDLQYLDLAHHETEDRDPPFRYRELDGPGGLRHFVSADDGRALVAAVLRGAARRMGQHVRHLSELDNDSVISLPPEEQYLVTTGRNYFRDLSFEQLHRLQFDLETTGLDAKHDRVFMISIRYPNGSTEVLEASGVGDAAEADLIRSLLERVAAADPDVIENHNLHGFDLPFLEQRSRVLGINISLGRVAGTSLGRRVARRGSVSSNPLDRRRFRFVAPGRELIDTLDAVRRHDFSTRDLPGHGLKAVARHLGIAPPDREYVRGDQIYETYLADPERVRRYATDDVEEVAALSLMLGGASFALAQMVPRRYERLADTGAATGMIDPMLIRAYLRAGAALPAHDHGDGTQHSGAALYLFASGVANRVVKADVASLYPSLMRSYRIGPARDRLGVLLALVDDLVERRLDAKSRARAAAPGSSDRHAHEALSAALKIVVNSAYGYMGAVGLTRFADVHAANDVTRRGREVLDLMCTQLQQSGVTLLEADTDGVYFAVPQNWTEAHERLVVDRVAALLPPLVQLEFEGRYASMLSHEPKNYALLKYDGSLLLRGVAFRSSRAEPYGERFLQEAIRNVLLGDVAGVRNAFLVTLEQLRMRSFSTFDVSSRIRLTKSPERYLAKRRSRREPAYEALLRAGRTSWTIGDRIRIYRKQNGETGIAAGSADADSATDRRDYAIDHYVRVLLVGYATRLARAFTKADFATVFADSEQPSLFSHALDAVRPILTKLPVVAIE